MKSDETGKLTITSDDRFMCFLPLAHILEFVYELYAIHIGATLGYGNPRTLTADSVRNCQGDLQEFKPTVLAGYLPSFHPFGLVSMGTNV
jgi:long-chain acyl-CoA synthetase